MDFDEAVALLKEKGFRATLMRAGTKTRVNLDWPKDDEGGRRGQYLPEWRVIQIAEAIEKGEEPDRLDPYHPARGRF